MIELVGARVALPQTDMQTPAIFLGATSIETFTLAAKSEGYMAADAGGCFDCSSDAGPPAATAARGRARAPGSGEGPTPATHAPRR